MGSVGLASLPRINSEDISYVVVAEKITDMFKKMEVMNDAIAATTARSIDNKDKLKKICDSDTAASTLALSKEFPELKRKSNISAQGNNVPPPRIKVVEMSGQQPTSQFQMSPLVRGPNLQPVRNTVSTDVNTNNTANKISPNIPVIEQSGTNYASITAENRDDWVVIRRNARPAIKQRRRRKLLEGTATGSGVRGAPRTRDMFISRVEKDTTDDQLRTWISEQNVNIMKFELLSHEDAIYKSFKLTVPVTDFTKLYEPSLWPVGVSIARYFAPRKPLDK